MAQRLRIRWRSRWRPPTTNHPPFPQEAASSDGAVPHPAFVTHVKAARKRLKVVSLPWAGQPVTTSQPPPSWKAAQILKRRSTAYDTLKSGDAALAASAPPILTAQGYPAWLPPAAIKRKPTRFTQQPTLLNEYPETPSTPSAESYPAWLPPVTHRRARSRFVPLTVTLNERPETPVVLTAQGYPAWLTPRPLKHTPTYRTHTAGAGDGFVFAPGTTPAVYPSFLRLTAIRRPRMRFDVQSTPLAEFPAPPSPSSDRGVTPTFVTRYSKARKLQKPVFAPVYPETGGEAPTAEGYPAWLQKQALPRRSSRFNEQRAPFAPEYPQAPANDAAGYPAWLSPKQHYAKPTYRMHNSGGGYVPATPAQPRLDAPKAIARRKTERRHLTAGFPPVYPQAAANTAQGYPGWRQKQAIRRPASVVEIQPSAHPPEYPAATVTPTLPLNRAIRRQKSRFTLHSAPFAPVYPQATNAQGYPAWQTRPVHRKPSVFRLLLPPHPAEYPFTPPPTTPAEYPSFVLERAISRRSTRFELLLPPHPAEYPETPPVVGGGGGGGSHDPHGRGRPLSGVKLRVRPFERTIEDEIEEIVEEVIEEVEQVEEQLEVGEPVIPGQEIARLAGRKALAKQKLIKKLRDTERLSARLAEAKMQARINELVRQRREFFESEREDILAILIILSEIV